MKRKSILILYYLVAWQLSLADVHYEFICQITNGGSSLAQNGDTFVLGVQIDHSAIDANQYTHTGDFSEGLRFISLVDDHENSGLFAPSGIQTFGKTRMIADSLGSDAGQFRISLTTPNTEVSFHSVESDYTLGMINLTFDWNNGSFIDNGGGQPLSDFIGPKLNDSDVPFGTVVFADNMGFANAEAKLIDIKIVPPPPTVTIVHDGLGGFVISSSADLEESIDLVNWTYAVAPFIIGEGRFYRAKLEY